MTPFVLGYVNSFRLFGLRIWFIGLVFVLYAFFRLLILGHCAVFFIIEIGVWVGGFIRILFQFSLILYFSWPFRSVQNMKLRFFESVPEKLTATKTSHRNIDGKGVAYFDEK